MSKKLGMIKLNNIVHITSDGDGDGAEYYVGWDRSGKAWVYWTKIDFGDVSDCWVREGMLDMMAGCECSTLDGPCQCEQDYLEAK